jgi:sulfatase maturation enzyme AslB (radical SAM superfamily)
MEKRGEIPIICLTDSCNQRCLFCSRPGAKLRYSPARIKKVIAGFKGTVCFEGGEPTLAPDVLKWVRYAAAHGVKDRVLVTNGFGLERPETAKAYLDAGVTMFNVNLPAHTPALFDKLTRTRANFPRRAAAVKNLIRLAGPKAVRVTLVLNTVILPRLAAYARWAAREFPGLFYLELNFPKLAGGCAERPELVPTLTAAEPRLREAFRVLEKAGVNFLCDSVPLCFMKGFERHSIDAHMLARGERRHYFGEKERTARCAGCSLAAVCSGPRKDYVARFGDAELRPRRGGRLPAGLKAGFSGMRRPAGRRKEV